jgi:hypothetical protein
MSNIEELRLRLEDAERRFGLKSAKNNQYSVRLVQLVDAVVDDLWVQRRDNERLNFENEEFRSMLMTLLATIEGGDKDHLRNMMADMAERIATLMAAGAGAPVYDPVLERYPDPEFDPEPEAEQEVKQESAPDLIPATELETEVVAQPEPAPQIETVEEETPLIAPELPEIALEVAPETVQEIVPEVVFEATDILPTPPPPDVSLVSEPQTPPTPAAENEHAFEAPEIDVDSITAAVAELANNTESIKPILDFGTAEPQSPDPVPVQDAQPVAAPVTETVSPPAIEIVAEQIDEAIAAPVPAPKETQPDTSPDDTPRTGEFADLHNVLDDIRELVGLIDIDTPFTPTEPGQV